MLASLKMTGREEGGRRDALVKLVRSSRRADQGEEVSSACTMNVSLQNHGGSSRDQAGRLPTQCECVQQRYLKGALARLRHPAHAGLDACVAPARRRHQCGVSCPCSVKSRTRNASPCSISRGTNSKSVTNALRSMCLFSWNRSTCSRVTGLSPAIDNKATPA